MYMNKLCIVGSGVGNEELLTQRAKDKIKSSQRILNSRHMPIKELLNELENNINGTTVVLVSGDCCFFSISKIINERFSKYYDIEMINGISSMQYLSSKIAINYNECKIFSAHGRHLNIVPIVSYNEQIILLTGGQILAQDICKTLSRTGLGHVKVIVGENLSLNNDERIVEGFAEDLSREIFHSLSIMYIENKKAVNPHLTLNDESFIRGKTPMTKEEVRWVSVSKLGILPTDIVYDIGAGTGSVSIEMARKAFLGTVYAIEMKDDALQLIEENRKLHGAFNLEIIKEKAPNGLIDLPIPDKVFIGGSSGNLYEILNVLLDKNPHVKVVVNAITLQTLNQILDSFKKLNLDNMDIACVNVSRAKKIGSYDMMIGQNPVYIIAGQRSYRDE